MLRITETVKHLILINVVMYFGTIILMGDPGVNTSQALMHGQSTELGQWQRYSLAMFYPGSPFFRPYQIITHMFMHASMGHIFFNMFALWMFGSALESVWGPKRFLTFYFISGIGALGLYLATKYLEMHYFGAPEYLQNVPMLGASGAVFGLLAGFGFMFPNSRIVLLIPPIPIKAKYFVLIYGGIELFLGVANISGASGVAHFAHVGGALFGFLLLLYWKNKGNLYS
jgi:membrane associated rhomboid family serine protease